MCSVHELWSHRLLQVRCRRAVQRGEKSFQKEFVERKPWVCEHFQRLQPKILLLYPLIGVNEMRVNLELKNVLLFVLGEQKVRARKDI